MNQENPKNSLDRLRIPSRGLATALAEIPLHRAPRASHWLTGDAAFRALQSEIMVLTSKAPKDHDVLIQAFGIRVTHVRYIEPHTLILRGFDHEGHDTSVVAHYSQLVAHILYLPKR